MTTILRATVALLATIGLAQAQVPGRGGESFEELCRPPLKFVAGACVAQCPAGYEDRGRVCQFRSYSSGSGGGR